MHNLTTPPLNNLLACKFDYTFHNTCTVLDNFNRKHLIYSYMCNIPGYASVVATMCNLH